MDYPNKKYLIGSMVGLFLLLLGIFAMSTAAAKMQQGPSNNGTSPQTVPLPLPSDDSADFEEDTGSTELNISIDKLLSAKYGTHGGKKGFQFVFSLKSTDSETKPVSFETSCKDDSDGSNVTGVVKEYSIRSGVNKISHFSTPSVDIKSGNNFLVPTYTESAAKIAANRSKNGTITCTAWMYKDDGTPSFDASANFEIHLGWLRKKIKILSTRNYQVVPQ